MDNTEYDNREMARASHRLYEIEKATLHDRQEAKRDFADSLTIPGRMGERVDWLLNGSYGYGEMLLAHRLFLSPRMNHVAALSQFIAAWDHQCPSGFARAAYRDLPKAEQDRLNAEVRQSITEWQQNNPK